MKSQPWRARFSCSAFVAQLKRAAGKKLSLRFNEISAMARALQLFCLCSTDEARAPIKPRMRNG